MSEKESTIMQSGRSREIATIISSSMNCNVDWACLVASICLVASKDFGYTIREVSESVEITKGVRVSRLHVT